MSADNDNDDNDDDNKSCFTLRRDTHIYTYTYPLARPRRIQVRSETSLGSVKIPVVASLSIACFGARATHCSVKVGRSAIPSLVQFVCSAPHVVTRDVDEQTHTQPSSRERMRTRCSRARYNCESWPSKEWGKDKGSLLVGGRNRELGELRVSRVFT